MSVQPTLISREISEYILTKFSCEDEFLEQLRAEAKENGIPEICISPEQGSFLQFLVKAANTKRVLEIGSLAGYSSITIARALPDDAKLTALEIELEYAHFIRRKVHEAGLEHKIHVINTNALNYLDSIKSDGEQFDLIFLDADKRNYIEYFEKCVPLLQKGGIFAADNAFAFGELLSEVHGRDNEEVEAIRMFNDYIRLQKNFMSCILPVGDGMILAVKL
jgi:predicted O-methyltransferase YrrM